MDAIINVTNLYKSYGTTIAVDDVSFDVSEGEIFGMVGPNGAGKTTTIECLEGLRVPDAGQVRVLGVEPHQHPRFLHTQAGMQLQNSNLPERIKVWEALDLFGSFYPTALDSDELLAQLGLNEKRNSTFSKLSGGQKQRLFIALALLHDPVLVFLDELTSGLDPQARHAIWDLVRDVHHKGKTIFLTTHYMEEAEHLCDRVAILDHGRIVALDKPSRLIQDLGGEGSLSFHVPMPLTPEFESQLNQIGRVEYQSDRVVVYENSHQTNLVSAVVSLLTQLDIAFSDLRTEQPTLEDVFLHLTGYGMKD